MWALTTLKDFRIAPCIRQIDMPKLLTLGMNNPVDFRIKAIMFAVRMNDDVPNTTCNFIVTSTHFA